MDENKNPEVAETISSNPVPAPQLAETTEAAEETAADAVVTEEVKENTYQETSAAVVPDTKAAVISRLKDIVIAGGEIDRAEVEMLKQTYYKLHNAEIIAARDAFVAAGGNVEDFMPAADSDEENFKAQLGRIRELRAEALQALEKQKQEGLAKKLDIIEKIKNMAGSPEEADKNYDIFKNLQNEWKEVKMVPAERATELWKNYQLYVEQFYDQLRLNHEMRAYDFKKNLEIKTRLCESAEKLAEIEDPVSAFHQLQQLHQEFRETGPVEKEKREEIWTRFKEASTVVNKRHQQHFEALKAREEENLVAKTALCEKVEAIETENIKSFSEWETVTKQVLDLQAQWKTIGFTPKKMNAKIFERFRAACDSFFATKTAHFKNLRETYAANLAAKNALCEKAEALKDSTDWTATANKLIDLQKEWKRTGPVNHKTSGVVWKRFNDACNYFLRRKMQQRPGSVKRKPLIGRRKTVLSQIWRSCWPNRLRMCSRLCVNCRHNGMKSDMCLSARKKNI